MQPGLVSIIIPVYNRPGLLVEAVDSAVAQTYRPIEIIVVDDGSTDQTVGVGQRLAREHAGIVRHTRVPHGGVARAMNEGLRLASGEFIQILDSDDLLLPDKLTLQVAGLRAHPDCGISYGYAREYRLGERWSGRPARRTGETFEQLFPAILSGKIWPAPAPLFRRSVFAAAGDFPDLSVHPEWEFECRAAALGVRLHHCQAYVCDTRGAHHLEGRRKGLIQPAQLDDYARVLLLVWKHAQGIDIPPAQRDRFALRLFQAARRCAAAGHEESSRQCLSLAREVATRWLTRQRIVSYQWVASRIGSQRTGGFALAIERSTAADVRRSIRRRPRAWLELWSYRAVEARRTIMGRAVSQWPALLKQRWDARESARR
jgi:glycosyltransferase involved in cell wall biosynthesis